MASNDGNMHTIARLEAGDAGGFIEIDHAVDTGETEGVVIAEGGYIDEIIFRMNQREVTRKAYRKGGRMSLELS